MASFTAEGRVGLDPEGEDRPGPVALAVAREFEAPDDPNDAGAGRLVVVGDADFARNRHIAEVFNVDLFLNMANWLVGEEEFITIERKRPRASRVVMTHEPLSGLRRPPRSHEVCLLGRERWREYDSRYLEKARQS